ncbi:MAG: hypothetical protein OXQ29_08690 [Rhodospirillaceae bacterium]|nr:hypothetical protein [Rhodospirillaceae bacterium]
MVAATFDDFVKQRTARARQRAEEFNREETLAAWRRELEVLYDAMEGYLKSYVDSGEIEIERRPVQITEEYLGTYEAEVLALSIGNDEVVAQPVGTLLIGSSGRVDLSGPRKTLRIVLLEKRGPTLRINISGSDGPTDTSTRSLYRGEVDHRGWYFVTKPPAATATALDKDSFRDAIMDVSSA